MNKMNRLLVSLNPHWMVGGAFLLFFAYVLARTIHPILGLIVIALTCVGWPIRLYQKTRRNWSPNVRGENAYQILGVGKYADTPTIRRAFRSLEAQYHPDTVPPERKAEATLLFIRINQAYELLTDTEKRFQYDGLLEALDGRIPPFEDTYQRIKDEDKHPIYAAYDAMYPPERSIGPGEWDAESRPMNPVASINPARKKLRLELAQESRHIQ